MKKLNELFPEREEDINILSIHNDSRYVGKDSMFFCVDGLTVDGHKYIEDAIYQGAKVIVHHKKLYYKHKDIIYIQVESVLDELNRVVDLFYANPSRKMTMIGITGSSGKTIVAEMIKQVLSKYIKMGFIGTNSVEFENEIYSTNYTTPDTIFLQRNLDAMVKAQVKGVAMEVSSHGLAMRRVDGIHFDIAIYTSIFDNHIDFHGTKENLMKSKARLMRFVEDNGHIILNADDVLFNHFLGEKKDARIITYGIHHRADVMARNISVFKDHSEFDISYKSKVAHINIPVVGEFNISNALAAITALLILDLSMEDIAKELLLIEQIEGRMEQLKVDAPINVIVDYCQYTSNMQHICDFIQKIKGNSRVIAVFGAPALKDFEKRETIAKLADKYFDLNILTEEEHYEDQTQIVCEELQSYIKNKPSIIVTDRKLAIEQAILCSNPNDIILILGKGHELFMNSYSGMIPYAGDSFIAKEIIKKVFS